MKMKENVQQRDCRFKLLAQYDQGDNIKKLGCVGDVVHMAEKKSAQRFYLGDLFRLRRRWKNDN